MKTNRFSPFRSAAVLVAFLSLASGLAAQVYTWTGASDDRWLNDANWNRSGSGGSYSSTTRLIDQGFSVLLSGGVAADDSLVLSGHLTIDGAAGRTGYTGEVYQFLGGILDIVAGGFVDSRSHRQTVNSGSILVSGFAMDGRRSTLDAESFKFGADRRSTQSMDVLDGGLVKTGRLYMNLPAFPYSTSTLNVSGVNANGTPSTLIASVISSGISKGRVASLNITDGGTVLTENAGSFGKGSVISVSGVAADGQRSTLEILRSGPTLRYHATLSVTGGGLFRSGYIEGGIVSASGPGSTLEAGRIRGSRLEIADGALVNTDFLEFIDFYKNRRADVNGSPGAEGTLETAGFGSVEKATISVDGGILRLTGNGNPQAKDGQVRIRIREGGMRLETPGEIVLRGSMLFGDGELTKSGGGSLELTGKNSFKGGTVIRDGTLILNNSAGSATGSGDVRVLGGGALGGGGSLAGNLFNNGIVAPGNSPGTLHIGGDFVQNSGGTLDMEIASAASHDLLQAGGNVRLGGALRIASSGSFEIGDSFRLIEAGGKIRGNFDSIQLTLGSSLRPNFATGGGEGVLLIAPASYTQVALSENETGLATVLDTWIGSGNPDEAAVVAGLDSLSAGAYHAAFSELSPALYQAGLDTALEQSQNQLAVLSQRLSSRQLQRDLQPDGKRWATWAISSGIYSGNTLSSVSGDEFVSGSFLTGLEMAINPALSLGLLAGSSESRGSFPGSSDIEIERAVLGAYAAWSQGGFHASSSVGGGRIDLDVDRAIGFGALSREASSDTDGTEFFAHAAGGYDFRRGNWAFGPEGGLQYSRVDFDDISESGAGALDLRVRGVEMDSLRSRLGGRVAYFQSLGGGLTLIPESRLFWQHEFLHGSQNLDATFHNGAGPSFGWHSAGADADSVIAGVAVGLQTGFGLYGNVAFDIELGREGDAINYFSLGADWKF